MIKLDDYIPIVGQSVIDELKLLAEKLKEKTVLHVNSTALGGGVAEILNRMIPLLNELGVNARWEVIKGGEQFFDVTKKMHNVLHGKSEPLDRKDFEIFLENTEENAQTLNTNADIVMIHDPQLSD